MQTAVATSCCSLEAVHEARIIPLDGHAHLPASVGLWQGDSRGRWEKQSLVVDTTNFSSSSDFLGSSDHLHIVERLTRVAADRLRVSDHDRSIRPIVDQARGPR